MKCFYHTDLDGECSAAIVLQEHPYAECIPINYNDRFPFESIDEGGDVFIVDFSLQKPGEWRRLMSITPNIVWIDHHKTAIEAAKDEGAWAIQGLRRIDDTAGCELTWEYFFGMTAPHIVSLVGDWDTWRFNEGDLTRQVHEALEMVRDTRPASAFWRHMFDEVQPGIETDIESLAKLGDQILGKKVVRDAETITDFGWEVEFAGRKGVAVNRRCNSQLFATVAEQFDLWLPCVFDGQQWTVSVYAQNGGDIDCSAIAKAHGGGGHKYAAGFQCDSLPFTFVRRLKA